MVAGDRHLGASPKRGRELLVVVGIVLHRLDEEVPLREIRHNEMRCHPHLNFHVRPLELFSEPRVKQDPAQFSRDRRREDELESAALPERGENPAGGAQGTNKGAGEDGGVRNGPKTI